MSLAVVAPESWTAPRLGRCLDALGATDWPSCEWLLIGEAEADPPRVWASRLRERADWTVETVQARTIARGLQLAIARSTGEVVVIMHADVEPLEPRWLARMIGELDQRGAGVVGPTLIVPATRGQGLGSKTPAPDLTIEGLGVRFRPGPGLPVPEQVGTGQDPHGPLSAIGESYPALLDPCVLVRRDVLMSAGPREDMDGLELSVELCLRSWRLGLPVVRSGDALAWHAGSSPAGGIRPNPETGMWHGLHTRWGPTLLREVWRDAIEGRGIWSSRPLRVTILAGPPQEPEAAALERSLRDVGWHVRASETDGPPDVAVILPAGAGAGGGAANIPRSVVRIGWLGRGPEEWSAEDLLDDMDLIAVDSGALLPSGELRGRPVRLVDGPHRLPTILLEWLERPRFAIHIGPPEWTAAPQWGDTWFGRAIARALERRGAASSVAVYAERIDAIALRADVALHVVGMRQLPLQPSQLNVLWIISRPDAVRAERTAKYDAVFVASDVFAKVLTERANIEVVPLHQATDPDIFYPEEGGPAHELLFVGNSRNVHRPALDALAGTARDLAVYGANWRPDLLDPRHLKGLWIPNAELHRYYASADIVLNDHWPDMRDEGFISNRVYDALASGAFVLSDEVGGIDTEFDGAVATWATPDELQAAIERWLSDTQGRRAMAERGRAVVLERHTFDHRISSILAAIEPLLADRPAAVKADSAPIGRGFDQPRQTRRAGVEVGRTAR